MPRFFFDFAREGERIADPGGVEMDSLAEAHLHAMRLIGQVLAMLEARPTVSRVVIGIRDDLHRPALTVLFPRPESQSMSEAQKGARS